MSTFALSSSDNPDDIIGALNYALANLGTGTGTGSNIGNVLVTNGNGAITISTSGNIYGYQYQYLDVAYANSATGGSGFSSNSANKSYFGLYNLTANTVSSNPTDYTWTQVAGGFGTTKHLYYQTTGGRQINFNIGTTAPTFYSPVQDAVPINLDLLTTTAGANGAPGANGVSGISTYTFPVYTYANSVPNTPAAGTGSWNFTTGTGIPPTDPNYFIGGATITVTNSSINFVGSYKFFTVNTAGTSTITVSNVSANVDVFLVGGGTPGAYTSDPVVGVAAAGNGGGHYFVSNVNVAIGTYSLRLGIASQTNSNIGGTTISAPAGQPAGYYGINRGGYGDGGAQQGYPNGPSMAYYGAAGVKDDWSTANINAGGTAVVTWAGVGPDGGGCYFFGGGGGSGIAAVPQPKGFSGLTANTPGNGGNSGYYTYSSGNWGGGGGGNYGSVGAGAGSTGVAILRYYSPPYVTWSTAVPAYPGYGQLYVSQAYAYIQGNVGTAANLTWGTPAQLGGGVGSTGQRGFIPMAYVQTISNPTTYTDAQYTYAFSANRGNITLPIGTGYSPVDGDVSQFYYPTGNISVVKQFAVSSSPQWTSVNGQVLNGNLFVTGSINASALAANQIYALTIASTNANVGNTASQGFWLQSNTGNATFGGNVNIGANLVVAGLINGSTLNSNTVGTSQIVASAVTGAKIATGTITGNLISANTITGNLISANTITGNLISANTITGNKIQANTITGSLIQANTIQGNSIVAGTITATQLAANAIVVGNITSFGATIEQPTGSGYWLDYTTGNVYFGGNTQIQDNLIIGRYLNCGAFASFGDGVSIAASATIGNGASIADRVTIGSNLTVGTYATIGTSLSVGTNASIGDNLRVGDNLIVGINALIGNNLTVGNSATIGANLTVGNNTVIGGNLTIRGLVTGGNLISNTVTTTTLVQNATVNSSTKNETTGIQLVNWYNNTSYWPNNSRGFVAAGAGGSDGVVAVALIPTTTGTATGPHITISYAAGITSLSNSTYNLVELWKSGASNYYAENYLTVANVSHPASYGSSTFFVAGTNGSAYGSYNAGNTWNSYATSGLTTTWNSALGYQYGAPGSNYYNVFGPNGLNSYAAANLTLAAAATISGAPNMYGSVPLLWGSAFGVKNYIVGQYGYTAYVPAQTGGDYTSATQQTAITINDLNAIAADRNPYTGTKTYMVAVGGFGTVLYNSAEITGSTFSVGTWTQASAVTPNTLRAVACSTQDGTTGGGTWVAVGDAGTILYSTNQTSWSVVTSPTTVNLRGVTYGNGYWVAVGDGGVICYSTNGTTWSSYLMPLPSTDNAYRSLSGIAYGGINNAFVAAGQAVIITSSGNPTSSGAWTITKDLGTAQASNLTRLQFWGSQANVANTTVAQGQAINNQALTSFYVDRNFTAGTEVIYYLVLGNMVGTNVYAQSATITATEYKR